MEIDFNDIKNSYGLAYVIEFVYSFSFSDYIDYNDLIVLEQEYETILNNLNIEMMPKDESLLKILKAIIRYNYFLEFKKLIKSLLNVIIKTR